MTNEIPVTFKYDGKHTCTLSSASIDPKLFSNETSIQKNHRHIQIKNCILINGEEKVIPFQYRSFINCHFDQSTQTETLTDRAKEVLIEKSSIKTCSLKNVEHVFFNQCTFLGDTISGKEIDTMTFKYCNAKMEFTPHTQKIEELFPLFRYFKPQLKNVLRGPVKRSLQEEITNNPTSTAKFDGGKSTERTFNELINATIEEIIVNNKVEKIINNAIPLVLKHQQGFDSSMIIFDPKKGKTRALTHYLWDTLYMFFDKNMNPLFIEPSKTHAVSIAKGYCNLCLYYPRENPLKSLRHLPELQTLELSNDQRHILDIPHLRLLLKTSRATTLRLKKFIIEESLSDLPKTLLKLKLNDCKLASNKVFKKFSPFIKTLKITYADTLNVSNLPASLHSIHLKKITLPSLFFRSRYLDYLKLEEINITNLSHQIPEITGRLILKDCKFSIKDRIFLKKRFQGSLAIIEHYNLREYTLKKKVLADVQFEKGIETIDYEAIYCKECQLDGGEKKVRPFSERTFENCSFDRVDMKELFRGGKMIVITKNRLEGSLPCENGSSLYLEDVELKEVSFSSERLDSITFSGCSLGELISLPQTNSLNFHGCQSLENKLSLTKKTKDLGINMSKNTKFKLDFSKLSPKLKKLGICYGPILPDTIGSLPDLEELYLSNIQGDPFDCSKLPNVKYLKLDAVPINFDQLPHAPPSLVKLSLSSINFPLDCSKLPNVKYLKLSDMKIDSDTLSNLPPSITDLHFSYTATLTPPSRKSIAISQSFNSLTLYSKIPNQISFTSAVKKLSLCNFRFDKMLLSDKASIPRASNHLSICDCSFTVSDLEMVMKKSLQSISFKNCDLRYLPDLPQFLSTQPHLDQVNIHRCYTKGIDWGKLKAPIGLKMDSRQCSNDGKPSIFRPKLED